ncbi:MAG: exosortase A [Proteobacteria bacterium]|nr:exosortase A [Pseudomonadota bacterium]
MAALAAPIDAIPNALRRTLLLLAALVLGLLLLFHDTVAGMVGIWSRSDTFAHGFLVLPISLWLIWRDRDRLLPLQPRPSLPWLLPMALAALAWLLGDVAGVNALSQFALVAMIVIAVPLSLGWPMTRAMLFPLLFLFFSVPVGEFLLPLLMERTADFTVAALRLSGIPVFREGLQFVIPSGNWSVVEACSGVRYLIASLMVGSLFAYLNYQSLGKRLVFVGVSIVVPIVANWIRAYMIVMLGHLSNNRIATGVDHIVYGWVFFGIVIMIMFMIGARWAEPDRPRLAAPAAGTVSGGASASRQFTALGLALLIAALPVVAAHGMRSQVAQAPVTLPSPVVAGQAGWTATADAADWQPVFHGAAAQSHVLYRRGDQVVGVYVGYYRNQDRERKLVSSINVLVPSNHPIWNAVGQSQQALRVGDAEVDWRSTHLLGATGGVSAPRRHRSVWQTFWVDDRFTPSDVQAKLSGMTGLLAGHGDDGAVIILHTDLAPEEGGNRLLAEFAQAHLPPLHDALRRARAAR